MPKIPKEHLKYDLLPNSRKGDWEVVSYDVSMLEELINNNVDISYPYQLKTLEIYYKKIDECIKRYPNFSNKLLEYKDDLIIRNNKLNWGVLRYIGKSNNSFTHNRYYYVPLVKKNDKVIIDGIIDDEEFTSYIGWDINVFDKFEVVVDPYNILSKDKL